jgi:hypothetical protein
MAQEIFRIGQYESKNIIPLGTRVSGTYIQKCSIAGNSITSSVFVESLSLGSSLLVEWYDYSTGGDVGEAYLLNTHNPISNPITTDRILISKLHDKPYVKCTVVGQIRFGVYITVGTSSASDIDSNLVSNLEPADFEDHKGIVVAGYDDEANIFRFLPITDNGLKISGVIDAPTDGLPVYPSGLRNAGRITAVTLNSTDWTALPPSPLVARNALAVQNYTGQPVKLNYSASIPGFLGIIIPDQSERQYDITDTIIVYGKCESGSAVVIVEEIS